MPHMIDCLTRRHGASRPRLALITLLPYPRQESSCRAGWAPAANSGADRAAGPTSCFRAGITGRRRAAAPAAAAPRRHLQPRTVHQSLWHEKQVAQGVVGRKLCFSTPVTKRPGEQTSRAASGSSHMSSFKDARGDSFIAAQDLCRWRCLGFKGQGPTLIVIKVGVILFIVVRRASVTSLWADLPTVSQPVSQPVRQQTPRSALQVAQVSCSTREQRWAVTSVPRPGRRRGGPAAGRTACR